MADLLVDRGVWWSIAVALAITALAAGVTAIARRPLVPAVAVHLPAIAAAALGAGVTLDRYLPGRTTGRGPDAGTRPWMFAVVGAAVMAVVVALAVGTGGRRRVDRPGSTPGIDGVLLSGAVAMAAIGVFACVPETALLRLVPGPLAVAAVGVAAGRLLASSRLEVIAVVAALGWIAVTDGWAREPSVIGAAACIATVGLVPLAAARPDRSPATTVIPWRNLAVLAVTVGICSRVAGILGESRWSTVTASAICALALAAGAGALWWLRGRPDGDGQPLRTTRGRPVAGRGRR